MSEFKREKRYVVLKIKDLHTLPLNTQCELQELLEYIEPQLPKREYVLVESDWPEYETVWGLIKARMEGKPNEDAVDAARFKQQRDKLLDALKECVVELEALSGQDLSCGPAIECDDYRAVIAEVEASK